MEFNDKALLKTAMKGIRPMIMRQLKNMQEVNMGKVVSVQKGNIRTQWVLAHPWYQSRAMDEYNELMEHIEALGPELLRLAQEMELKCRKTIRKNQIRQEAIEASVRSMLDGAGYTNYSMARQEHRIKLTVGMENCVVVLPLKYSGFPAILDNVMPALKDAERISREFGRDLKIY